MSLTFAGGPIAAADASTGPDDASGSLSTVLTTTGHDGYTSAGIGMRNLGYGTIDLSGIPDGATVKSATLLWDVLGDTAEPAFADGVVDGTAITGTQWASGASPCWYEAGSNFSYEADVTSLVHGNGAYALSGFSSGDTNGQDPWDAGSDSPLLEGASLVVVYEDDSLPESTIQLAAGAAETDPDNPSIDATLDGFAAVGTPDVTTTYIVADGQLPGNTAAFDDATLDDVSFPGAAPQAVPDYSRGNLWDNVTADVSAEAKAGGTSADLSIGTTQGDCLVWVGQVLDVADGCQQVTDTDGDYQFGGCVTAEDDGTEDVTDAPSNLDGIDVSASPADQVTYDDGGSAGDFLTSAGDSTLALSLDGTQIPVDHGKLDDSLTAPVSVTAPARTVLAGLPIAGKLTVDPRASKASPPGTATVTVAATLPAVLDGGPATLTATTTVNRGITGIKVTAARASFLRLFRLSDVVLSYRAGAHGGATWHVTATASAGGGSGTPLTGTLDYDAGGALEAASLSTGAITLAGLVNVTKLDISDKHGAWAGTAVIGAGTTATTAAITLDFDASGLRSGSIKAAHVSLFHVFDVSEFELGYAAGTWTISGQAAGGGGASGSMTAADGVVTAARLTLAKLSFLGKFTVSSATVSYGAQAANHACPGVAGHDIWCGDWQVRLPQASSINGVSGSLAVADGAFASGSVDVTGNVPLLDGIFLTKLGGKVTVNPPPTTISGDAGLSFGPKIRGKSLLAFDGTLTRALPSGDDSGFYDLRGTLSALGRLTGDVHVNVPGDGSATTIELTATAAVGRGASARGTLDGSFTSGSFTLAGHATITIGGHPVTGSMKADDKGIAACGTYRKHSAGFEYAWATDSITFLGDSGCSEKGF